MSLRLAFIIAGLIIIGILIGVFGSLLLQSTHMFTPPHAGPQHVHW